VGGDLGPPAHRRADRGAENFARSPPAAPIVSRTGVIAGRAARPPTLPWFGFVLKHTKLSRAHDVVWVCAALGSFFPGAPGYRISADRGGSAADRVRSLLAVSLA
jgi:hypothetical protein